ncbi:phosphoribosylglycinamide formyltransferase [Alisedimentitalea sp. MJ-SS2]|uniref:phosphoribosylglycinamide formyltransferase n=1 Tax=Aliisedimentitalea sp. MJ-SS2 TaxID=3049795 RepID=UPI00290C37B8|nr:phosphoribosylglycinamide formyltransferase [Alisedimentitalea sp. MJ-SS2]MDU8926813.1 phosphoribosylglycinamide formyltransferase [Alisedimentitalea sp. MJ-SS2]
MKRVAILISGGGSNMVKLVESMTGDHPARPCLVLANSEDAGGLKKAGEMGVATAWVDHKHFKGDREAFEKQLISVVDAQKPDIICLAGFMRILTPFFINHYEGRMLNIHPSLLPKYRGLHTHKRALEAGDTEAGCTVHEATAELDDGPILGQAQVPIEPGDTPETLAARVLKKEHQLYPAVLRRFAEGNRKRIEL